MIKHLRLLALMLGIIRVLLYLIKDLVQGKLQMKDNIHKYIHKLRTYPLDVIISKAVTKVKVKSYRVTDRARAVSRGTRINDGELLQALYGFDDIESVKEQLLARSYYLEDIDLIKSTSDPDLIIRIADSICQGRMEILGRMTQFPEGRIDWHSDFTCGFKWSGETYFADIVYGNVPGADIKIPWELGRLQFLYPVMNAYTLSEDKCYLDYVISTVKDWIEKNPPKLGPGWACTMDVGIRAANLCIIYSWLQQHRALDGELALEIFRSLYSHADYITHNLEYDVRLTSNHYLSDIVGLLYIGAFFPEFKPSDEWVAYSIQELISEMKRQVHEEGSDFEASTCYHRLVSELFLSATILVQSLDTERRRRIKAYNCRKFKPLVGPRLKPLNKQEFNLDEPPIFPAWYRDRLEKMLEFIMYLSKADGRIPQIGDNDSGRLHKFTLIGQWNPETDCFEEDFLDNRHLLAVGGELFDRDDFREVGLPYQDECLWYGLKSRVGYPSSREDAEQCSLEKLKTLTSRAYPQFGLYIMRHEDNYMAIRCGDIGQNGQGGHAHNDQLSLVLNVGGEDVFVDPGTYLYTPSPQWRNYFRSTACHNTVMVDGEEQNWFYDWNLFALNDDARATCSKWETGEDGDVFEGEHYGYQILAENKVHVRKVVFKSKQLEWTINDQINNSDQYILQWNFVLSPQVNLAQIDQQSFVLEGKKSKVIIQLEPGFKEVITEDGYYSPKYGVVIPTKIVRLIGNNCSDYKIKVDII